MDWSSSTGRTETIRGYALAVGWWADVHLPAGRNARRSAPELFYLVADPQRAAPAWLPQGAIDRHFRSFTRASEAETAADSGEAAGASTAQ